MQTVRKHIVSSLLGSHTIQSTWVDILRHTHNILKHASTSDFQREMLANNGEKFNLNIKDEIVGLEVCFKLNYVNAESRKT
jgi:hypothetical protein